MSFRRLCRFLGLGTLVAGCAISARATTITFDTDADGNPLAAPLQFSQTTALTELYAPLGVHFHGPVIGQGGGAILNQGSNFGFSARSDPNFLAFFRSPSPMYDYEPEDVLFDSGVTDVSIYAGASVVSLFTITAYDSADNVLCVSQVNNVAKDYALLSVSAQGIRRVSLQHTRVQPPLYLGDAWVYDDLTFTSSPGVVPEPGSMALLLSGAVPAVLLHRRRR